VGHLKSGGGRGVAVCADLVMVVERGGAQGTMGYDVGERGGALGACGVFD
jgi:hypothetical protein